MVRLGPLSSHSPTDGDIVADSLTEALTNWDLVGCSPACRKPLRTWRWRAPRAWTCPGCRTRYTREAGTWVELLADREIARLESELLDGP